MFGFSLVQLATRQEAAGVTAAGVGSVLLRRNGWLVVFGFLHAALDYDRAFDAPAPVSTIDVDGVAARVLDSNADNATWLPLMRGTTI